MQPLQKRQILDKSNGAAAAVFNPSMFHYQQALANMQLQQTAFIPTGEFQHILVTRKHSSYSVTLPYMQEVNWNHEPLGLDSGQTNPRDDE